MNWVRARKCVALLLSTALFSVERARAAYTAVELYTLTAPAGFDSKGPSFYPQATAPGGRVVGSGFGTGIGGNYHALLWNGSSVATDLNPTNLGGITDSYAYGISGAQQVGTDRGAGTGNNYYALLRNGSSVAVDLNPTNLGGITTSEANGTSGAQQVGFGSGAGTGAHAMLWNGSSVATDLNPTNLTGITNSLAYGTSGAQQVGYGSGPGTLGDLYSGHALLWNGSSFATDLNPTNLTGVTSSRAYGTRGNQQVGYGYGAGTGYNFHALLWNGSSVAVDLHALLPANFVDSRAYSLDASGNVFGTAQDNSGNPYAIEWAVPEPTSLGLIALGAMAMLRRNRRAARSA